MSIYELRSHAENIRNLAYSAGYEGSEGVLGEEERFLHYDGQPVAVVQASQPALHLCVHDNHKIKDATLTMFVGDAKVDIPVLELLQALSISAGRDLVIGEQSAHLLGFTRGSGPHTVQEAVTEEKRADKAREVSKKAVAERKERIAKMRSQK